MWNTYCVAAVPSGRTVCAAWFARPYCTRPTAVPSSSRDASSIGALETTRPRINRSWRSWMKPEVMAGSISTWIWGGRRFVFSSSSAIDVAVRSRCCPRRRPTARFASSVASGGSLAATSTGPSLCEASTIEMASAAGSACNSRLISRDSVFWVLLDDRAPGLRLMRGRFLVCPLAWREPPARIPTLSLRLRRHVPARTIN
jgi:hypothetical protein